MTGCVDPPLSEVFPSGGAHQFLCMLAQNQWMALVVAAVGLLLIVGLLLVCCCCRPPGCCGSGVCHPSMKLRGALAEGLLGAGSEGHYSGALQTGWLQKQGHVRKSWRRRFFVLESTMLLYYKSPSDLKPQGQVLLGGVTLLLAEASTGRRHCFGIFHPARETYFLSASSEAEMLTWVRAIRRDDRVGLLDFECLAKLGQGNFGKVLLARKRCGLQLEQSTGGAEQPVQRQYYAMKVLKKDTILKRKDLDHARNERMILQAVKHPFLVQLHYAFQTADRLYMLMDFIPGGDLSFHLKRLRSFSEPLVRVWMAELTLALEYMHKLHIVYRDLKPENILLDAAGHLRLTDFGLSKEQPREGGGLSTFCGTPYYVAPEMLVRGRRYSSAVDWWSLGILMYELLVGQVRCAHRPACCRV